jgi:hypothetical protein
MEQPPAILVRYTAPEDLSTAELEELVEEAIAWLPPTTRSRFYEQMASSGTLAAADILTTNAFDLAVPGVRGKEAHHYGNFIDVSIYNHDCRPKYVTVSSNFFDDMPTDCLAVSSTTSTQRP